MNSRINKTLRSCRGVLIACLALTLTASVWAQRPGGPPPAGPRGDGPRGGGFGPRIDPQDMEAAWRLEASHTAEKIGIGGEKTTQLEAAYIDARQEQERAIREGRRPGDGPPPQRGPEFREARQDAFNKSREEFRASLAKFLSETETNEALTRLGTFNREFDAMVHAIRQFNLGQNQSSALETVSQYVIDVQKQRESLRGGGDFRSMRQQFESKREALDAEMAKILGPDQLNEWKEVARMRRGGARGNFGGPPPEGGRRRGGPPGGGPPQQ